MASQKRSFLSEWGLWIAFVAGVSLVVGAALQIITASGDFWSGLLAGSALLFLVGLVLLFVWTRAGRGKILGWMMVTAFMLRLTLGAFLNWGLPRYGYDTLPQEAGFVFEDAYRRDRNAWTLAQSSEPLTKAFSDAYGADQYGGMLALSALVYRIFSPNTYRPVMIVILTAGAMALSLPFLVAMAKRQFGRKIALLAGWILALYPEGALLGASQMREPFFILFLCVLFWATEHWLARTRLRLALPVFFTSIFLFFLFSYRVAIMVVGAILLWVLLIEMSRSDERWRKWAGWGLVAGLIGLGWFVFRDWVVEVLNWDIRQTVIRSGMVQFQLEHLPAWLSLPFVVTYGLFQPVLPAAIAVPGPWIWKSLGVFRSVGWYALLPLLAYSALRIWKTEPDRQRKTLTVLLVVVWAWVLIASARAGGDQWDNPRYRAIFLPWMAILGAWAIHFARATKDRWLLRWILIELVFLGFFTEWYISRYYPVIPRLDFGLMIVLILAISLLIIVVGWLRDKRRVKEGNRAG